jgi:hypothetical protein
VEDLDLKNTEEYNESFNGETNWTMDADSEIVHHNFETTEIPVEKIPSHSSIVPPGGRGLKLKTKKEVGSDVQVDQSVSDIDNKNTGITTSKAGPAKGSTHSSPRHNPDLNLGAEFDVMSIDIKKKETRDEIDELFADMQPQIKTESLDLFTMLAKAEETQRKMEAKQMARMREESKVLLAYKTGDQVVSLAVRVSSVIYLICSPF